MTLELWIGLIIVAAGAAFFIGRLSASKRAEIDALNAEVERLKGQLETNRQQADAELAAAETKAEQVEAGVSSHFEQSAVLFGKLAQDYRAFLEHFSESAQQLGLSEARSRELIEQVTSPLISHEPVVTEEAAEPVARGRSAKGSPQGSPQDPTKDSPKASPQDAPSGSSTPRAVTPNRPKKGPDVPTLDPISAKVAEIELAEAEAPRRAS